MIYSLIVHYTYWSNQYISLVGVDMAEAQSGSAGKASELGGVQESGEDYLVLVGIVVLEVVGVVRIALREESDMAVE